MKLNQRLKTERTRLFLTISILLSLLGHCFAVVMLERFGPFNFNTAITEPAVVMVDIGNIGNKLVLDAQISKAAPLPIEQKEERFIAPAVLQAPSTLPPEVAPLPTELPDTTSVQQAGPVRHQQPAIAPQHVSSPKTESFQLSPDSIVPVQLERLTYQINLAGMPVGSAQLEASNKHGELRITSSIRSNSAISAFYPVNDSTDTRLIKGRYLLTRIRLHEGFFVSDTGFNLMFHEKKIFWVDRLKNRYSNEPLESMDTLDFISGFYFMRLQPLKIGTTITLSLYDGDTTVLVPVEVLRQEQLALPGLRSVETLVIKPTFSKSGFFKNNHDLLIWLTNDENRVPVRIESTTPIGRIVAELVASERILPAAAQEPVSSIVPADKMQYR